MSRRSGAGPRSLGERQPNDRGPQHRASKEARGPRSSPRATRANHKQRSEWAPDRSLVILLVLAALLAVGFAWATPMGANPDESAHLEYVKTVSTRLRLPVLPIREHRRNRDKDVNYESHQAPLYYVLAAPFYLAGAGMNPEKGPGQACRVLSIGIGLVGTWLVWLLAREVAPRRPGLWLAAAGITALLPMRLAIISSVSNDALAETSATLALLLTLRALRGPWTSRQWLALGGALALALLAKQNNILLLPSVGLGMLIAARNEVERAAPTGERPRDPKVLRLAGKSLAAVGAVVLLLAGWFFLRNQLLYGDPLAKRAFDWYFADTPTWEWFRAGGFTFARYMNEKILPTTFDSFWGVFGYMNMFMGAYGPPRHFPRYSWLYPILEYAVLVAVAGGALYAIRKRIAPLQPPASRLPPPASRPGVALLALHAAFVTSAFLTFVEKYFQAQGRYFFPAMGAITLALAGGWLEWVWPFAMLAGRFGPGGTPAALPGATNEADVPEWISRTHRWEVGAGWGIVAAMLVLACYALFAVLIPGFAHS